MPKEQAVVWRRITERLPYDWFRAEHLDVLRAYCMHVAVAEVLARQVEAFDPLWFGEDGGLERFDQLSRLLDREHRMIVTLARTMRITHQAQYQPRTAATAANARAFSDGRAPWTHIE